MRPGSWDLSLDAGFKFVGQLIVRPGLRWIDGSLIMYLASHAALYIAAWLGLIFMSRAMH